MRVGITGHQRLPDESAWGWVGARIDDFLEGAAPLTGLTSLAIGADQLFAERVLAQGGSLHVIVPHQGYEETFDSKQDRYRYEWLLGMATQVEILNPPGSRDNAYLRAGYRVADLADVVLAVWNGEAGTGKGGTADMVEYALRKSVPLIHLNPITGEVTQHGAA